jgi:hypothetical protein
MQGGKYGSALEAASSEKKIVALLRTHGASPSTVNKQRHGNNKPFLDRPDKYVPSAPHDGKIGKVDGPKKLAKKRNEIARKSGHDKARTLKSTSGTSTEAAKGKARIVVDDMDHDWVSDAEDNDDTGRGWVSDEDDEGYRS